MNWIKNSILSFVQKAKDKFKKERASKKDQEQSLWINCPGCNQMQLKEDLKQNFNICKCSHHFDLDPKIRFKNLLFDEGHFDEIECPSWSSPDPLNIEINGKKYIDKYKGYQKKTGQQSALLIGHGKIGGIKAVVVGYNFSFGGAAFSQRENEHFLAAAQFAIENEVELFLSIYQSGGMSVYGNIHSLKSMSVCQMVHTMLKKKNIINIGILGSKITGGTFVNIFANDFLFSENPVAHDQLFSGKRVSAGVRSSDNTEMPNDFGEGTFLEKHGMIDGCFTSRLEVKTNIVTLTKVLLKKAETQAKNEASNVTVDPYLQAASKS
tara:strand:- start:1128 stop:2096 length:969 start_codon:yes stop_codon:yes gene_type:complete